MYESPIKIIQGQIQTQLEGDILRAIQKKHIEVDKEELVKALELCVDGLDCSNCAFDDEDESISECTSKLAKAALDLIQRQQERIDKIVEQLEALAEEHPYKVQGDYDTYSNYNEAWSYCTDRAITIVKGGAE